MRIPLLDLKLQYQSIKPEIDAAVARVLESSQFIMGPEVQVFEREVAAYCGVPHAIGVASGTDALLLSLRALGIRPSDKVITSSFTFGATATAICNAGATPVFVDIDPHTFNMDPNALETCLKESPTLQAQAKAIIPVHLYGQMADMDPIMNLAQEYGLFVVEDAAQAIGATYKGKQAGAVGNTGCFSFFPSKNLGAYGDGGMVITHDDAVAEKLRLLRVHGSKLKYYHKIIGCNSRLDALQAAILRVKLQHLDSWSQARRDKAERYDALFQATDGVEAPYVASEHTHIYHQYTVRVKAGKRDALASYLKEKGIGTSVYYPLPLHLQECFAHLGYCKGDLPQSEKACEEVLSLPIFPELEEIQIQTIVDAVQSFVTA